MGYFQFKNSQKFDDLVIELGKYGFFTLSSDGVVSFNNSQKKRFEELGFLFFCIIMYSSIYKDLAVCKNKDYYKEKCLLLLPDSSLLSVFKSGKALSDRVVYELPQKNKLLSTDIKVRLQANLKSKHPKLNKVQELRTWGNLYELISSDLRYLVTLGGLGFEAKVDSQAVDIFLKDFPSWESSQVSHLLDIYLTIIKAGYYSDTSIYCANSELKEPFASYELDSILFKTSGCRFGEVDSPNLISRLVVTETSICSDAGDLLVKNTDFIKALAHTKGDGDYIDVAINKNLYVPIDTANDTAFRNKLITYLAFKNTEVQNFGYIFFILKFGIANDDFLKDINLATTYFCLTRSANLEIVEINVEEKSDFFESVVSKGSPVSRSKLYKPYRKMLKDYRVALSKYK